jgi:arabinose-5-phosphate isomerase
LALAAEVLHLEAEALQGMADGLKGARGEAFLEAVEAILSTSGLVVVTGMGKAGLVGAKISATLASTGTPSMTLHPAEAVHGDLGRVRRSDVVLCLSNSGETGELKAMLAPIRRTGAKLIAMLGDAESTLARHADIVLELGAPPEACPLGLAPTTSTSAMLALGDALAMVVLEARGFSREDFARYHPAGSLGRRLMRVGEVMRKDAELPLIPSGTVLRHALVTMSKTPGRPGAGLIVDPTGALIGIFTDGDLRRLFESDGLEALDAPIDEAMGKQPKSITTGALVDDAMRLLHTHRIDQLAVCDEAGRPVGLLDIQDLLEVRI